MRFFMLLFLIILPIISFCQTDTLYYNEKWEKTSKDSAYFYGYIYKSDNIWKKKDFYSSNQQLQMSGSYLDSNRFIKTGIFVWYRQDGKLADSILYENNFIKEAWYFHENGNISAHEIFEKGKLTKISMWNEEGMEIDENYRDPLYKSPYKTWKEYILIGMEINQPKAYRKGKIDGFAVIQFYIGKDGFIRDASVLYSSGHPELDEHALNIIKNSLPWTPPRQHGRRIIAKREQRFTYPSLSKFDD